MAVPSTPYVTMSVKRERTASMPTSGSTQRSTAPASSAAPISSVPYRNTSSAVSSSPSPTAPSTVRIGHCRAGAGASPGAARPPPSGRAVSLVNSGKRRVVRRGRPSASGRADRRPHGRRRLGVPRSAPAAACRSRISSRGSMRPFAHASADTALRRLDHVDEQLGAGHRADAARVRGDPAGDLGDARVDVADDLALGVAARHRRRGRRRPASRPRAGSGAAKPAAATMMSALPEVRGQVTRAGVALGHRRVLAAPGQQQRHRAADGDTAADDHDLGALDLDAVAAQQGEDAVRGAGQRGRLVQDEAAEVHRVQAVRVLVRVHQFQDAVLVDALGQRQLDDVAGAGGVLVELADDRLDLLLGGGVGQFALDGGDADLGAVAVLAGDVLLAAGVVADEDRAEAGRDALLLQRRHAGGQIGLDRGCGGLAIENLGGHGPILADDRRCSVGAQSRRECTARVCRRMDHAELHLHNTCTMRLDKKSKSRTINQDKQHSTAGSVGGRTASRMNNFLRSAPPRRPRTSQRRKPAMSFGDPNNGPTAPPQQQAPGYGYAAQQIPPSSPATATRRPRRSPSRATDRATAAGHGPQGYGGFPGGPNDARRCEGRPRDALRHSGLPGDRRDLRRAVPAAAINAAKNDEDSRTTSSSSSSPTTRPAPCGPSRWSSPGASSRSSWAPSSAAAATASASPPWSSAIITAILGIYPFVGRGPGAHRCSAHPRRGVRRQVRRRAPGSTVEVPGGHQ